jgi:Domain of Unknown Function (DUF1206)
VGEAKQQAAEIAQTPAGRGLARWGLVSKGALYILIGAIAAQVALLDQGRLQDRGGALATLADETYGKVLVGALAVGLLGYALWRLAEAWLGRPLEGGKKHGFFKRIGLAARGLWYLGICVIAGSVLVGANESSGSGEEDRATARVLDFPAGRWIVAGVGAGILVAAAFNVWRGLTGRFKKNLKLRKMGETEERVFMILGAIGHVARGVVFGLIGFFLVRAAYEYDPEEAVGLDGALAKLLRQDYGSALLGLVALGLIAYGLYCFVEARYREV